jgi:dipeptidyl aminopeptidase/acylaminoacyl peptidase
MEPLPLIRRKLFFGNPDRASVQISPDGSRLSWLAPLDGVLNVWVAPRDDVTAAKPVTHDTGRGIRIHFWAYPSHHVLYLQDRNGDENWRLHAVDLATGNDKDLTPFDGVQARIVAISHKVPGEIVVGLNNRDPRWHDIHKVEIASGAMRLMLQHDRFMSVTVDHDYRLLNASQMAPDGGLEVYVPDGSGWRLWDTVPVGDMLTTSQAGLDKTGRTLFMRDSRGRNTAALVAVDLRTKETTLLAEDAQADAANVVCHPSEKHVQAVSFVHARKRWKVLDPSIEPDLAYLRSLADGEVEIASRSLDDRSWVVAHVVDDGPVRFHLHDRSSRSATFLFTNRRELEGLPLAKMLPAVIRSRDGLDLVAYYTLPPNADRDSDGIPSRPLPMVFIPHGGPWGRDYWGYHPWHQWLANRGYAVLSVNFRASTGFGKAFVNAGDREWGGKIVDDQVDAVQWAVRSGIADPARVAVLGASFGGYSALAGLTLHPGLYACGVDLVGPSNLITLLEAMPPYWRAMLELFTTRVGDHRTEDGRELLRRHSPLTYADRIRKPLLIGQGANDPRVKQAESDQIVHAMQARGIPVTYVLYPDEGHGFARPENNLSFYAITEAFLAKCIGGRMEPIGNDFQGSSLQVLMGAEEIPGLKDVSATPGGAAHSQA